MFVRIATVAVLMGGLGAASAEVVQLKDKSSVTGRILAEKKDQVVVDLGYTVLAIPRSQIVHVIKDEEAEGKSARNKPRAATAAKPAAESPLPSKTDNSGIHRPPIDVYE